MVSGHIDARGCLRICGLPTGDAKSSDKSDNNSAQDSPIPAAHDRRKYRWKSHGTCLLWCVRGTGPSEITKFQSADIMKKLWPTAFNPDGYGDVRGSVLTDRCGRPPIL